MPGDGAAVVVWEASAANGSPVSGSTLSASPGGATTSVAGDVTATASEGLDNGAAYRGLDLDDPRRSAHYSTRLPEGFHREEGGGYLGPLPILGQLVSMESGPFSH
jgi:hypothetical protein